MYISVKERLLSLFELLCNKYFVFVRNCIFFYLFFYVNLVFVLFLYFFYVIVFFKIVNYVIWLLKYIFFRKWYGFKEFLLLKYYNCMIDGIFCGIRNGLYLFSE